MHDERCAEELVVAIAAGPGALPEFYQRHVAKVTGMGARWFNSPEDVADFVANVFVEVMRSAGRYDQRRGAAVSWLYGLAGNVAAGMRRQQVRQVDAEHRLAGRALLDADDYARVEERIDAASALRRTYEALRDRLRRSRRCRGSGMGAAGQRSTGATSARARGRGHRDQRGQRFRRG